MRLSKIGISILAISAASCFAAACSDDGSGDSPSNSSGGSGTGGDDTGSGGDDTGTGGDDTGTGGDDTGTGGNDNLGGGGSGTGGGSNASCDIYGERDGEEELTGTITTNKTLTADKVWKLKGTVWVNSGATLTIEPCTRIEGVKNSGDPAILVITRGAKIDAEGTKNEPILFTSDQATGSRKPGDWGGVILLGKAPNNQTTTPVIEGLSTDDDRKEYGGNVPDDDSGTRRFMRLRAGVAYEREQLARNLIAAHFNETSRRFIDALAKVLPQIGIEELYFRFHFLLGAQYYTLLNPNRIYDLSGGLCDPADAEKALRHMVCLFAAGLRAPECLPNPSKEPHA